MNTGGYFARLRTYTHLNFLYTVGEAGKVLANHWYAITKLNIE